MIDKGNEISLREKRMKDKKKALIKFAFLIELGSKYQASINEIENSEQKLTDSAKSIDLSGDIDNNTNKGNCHDARISWNWHERRIGFNLKLKLINLKFLSTTFFLSLLCCSTKNVGKTIFRGIKSTAYEMKFHTTLVKLTILYYCVQLLYWHSNATDIRTLNYRLCIIMLSPYPLFLFMSNYRSNISVWIELRACLASANDLFKTPNRKRTWTSTSMLEKNVKFIIISHLIMYTNTHTQAYISLEFKIK